MNCHDSEPTGQCPLCRLSGERADRPADEPAAFVRWRAPVADRASWIATLNTIRALPETTR